MSGKRASVGKGRPLSPATKKFQTVAKRVGRQALVAKKMEENTRLKRLARGIGVTADSRSSDGIKQKWHEVSFFDLKEDPPKTKSHQRQVSKLNEQNEKAATDLLSTAPSSRKPPGGGGLNAPLLEGIGNIGVIPIGTAGHPNPLFTPPVPTSGYSSGVYNPYNNHQTPHLSPQAHGYQLQQMGSIDYDDDEEDGEWEDEEQGDVEQGEPQKKNARWDKRKSIDIPKDEIDGSRIQLNEKGKVVLTHFPYFIVVASLAQIAMLIWELYKQHWFLPISQNMWYGPSSNVLIEMGAKYVPAIKNGQSYRWFLAIWLHAGIIHLALNLIMQLSIGIRLERAFGWYRVGPIYLLSGIFGNIVSSIFLPNTLTVGASGAIFGLEAVLIAEVLQLWSKLRRPFLSLLQTLFSCVVLLASGIAPKTDNFAHVGGFIMGFTSALMLLPTMVFGKWHVTRRVFFFTLGIVGCIALFAITLGVFFLSVDAYAWCGWCEFINCVPITPNWCSQSAS